MTRCLVAAIVMLACHGATLPTWLAAVADALDDLRRLGALVLGQPSTDGWHGHPTLGDHETVRITWLRKGAWPCHPAIHPFRLDRALVRGW